MKIKIFPKICKVVFNRKNFDSLLWATVTVFQVTFNLPLVEAAPGGRDADQTIVVEDSDQ